MKTVCSFALAALATLLMAEAFAQPAPTPTPIPTPTPTPGPMPSPTPPPPMSETDGILYLGFRGNCPVGYVPKETYAWSNRSHRWVVSGYTCEEDIYRGQ